MIKILFFITSILLLSCQSKHWSYSENHISNSWANISKDYQLCRDGNQQSPIDLSMSISKKVLQKINIDYHDDYAEVLNDGHTIKEKFKKSNHIEINNHKYYLNQLHFHAHSEHSLDGIYYPLEIHLVHQSLLGELAVVALLVEISSKKKNEYGFFKNIDKGKTFVKLSKISNMTRGFFYYEGSLTTPPCTENVKWVILDKHIILNRSQLEPFKKYYRNNYRPINEYNEHKLEHSNFN